MIGSRSGAVPRLLSAPGDERSLARAQAGRSSDGAEVELVAQGEREPSAFVTGRLLDPDGTPRTPKAIWAIRRDQTQTIGDPSRSADQRFRLGPLLAGEYTLLIPIAPGLPDLHRAFVLAEGEELDLGDLALPRCGEARLTLLASDGQPLPAPLQVLLMEDERYGHPFDSTDGRVYGCGPLWPGTYLLRVTSGAAAPAGPVPIEIRAGRRPRPSCASLLRAR